MGKSTQNKNDYSKYMEESVESIKNFNAHLHNLEEAAGVATMPRSQITEPWKMAHYLERLKKRILNHVKDVRVLEKELGIRPMSDPPTEEELRKEAAWEKELEEMDFLKAFDYLGKLQDMKKGRGASQRRKK